ncbi:MULTISPECIES: hypothetical protein [unclassified Corynebacterium]|uniref:hypothetical protein n=1 Tax=unclassified Corynebacterium TaxID=2624378 RepID=UPI0021052DB9|nr:hypothetical protein [Corynebacterium sp. SY003]
MGRDNGMVTLESALVMAVMMMFVSLLVGALFTIGAYISAVDIAGAAARAYSIGIEYTPSNGKVRVQEQGELISVTATVPAFFIDVQSSVVFPKEQF